MNLKEARERKELTQMRLSEMSGIHFITLSDYERGAKVPILENMIKLEKILGKIDWDEQLEKFEKYYLVESFKVLIEGYPLWRVAYFLYKHSERGNSGVSNVIDEVGKVLRHIEEVKAIKLFI